MMKTTWLLFIFSLLCLPQSLNAVELSPFHVRNLSPVAILHGIAIAESPRVLPRGKNSVRLSFDIANNASSSNNTDEVILLDGETYLSGLGIRYGLTEKIQLGFDLSYINHSGGFLDSFISDWHDFFGLPNGDRDRLPNDQLNYTYKRDNLEFFNVSRSTGGWGDLSTSMIYEFATRKDSSQALKLSVKIPTGDAEKLTGSGAWDASLAIMTLHDFQSSLGHFSVWSGLAGNYLGQSDILNETLEDWAISAWVGMGWNPGERFALKLQFDSHSALYDSELTELGDPSLIMSMGGTVALSEKTALDIAVGEDLAVSASPDITFHFGISHRF